jgi:alanyl-tRNA synthetase
MTDRIYYTQPWCRAFDALVCRVVDSSGRPALVLDRTAFYPTSGGQPFDTGRLDSTSVIDVEDHDGEIVHVVPVALPPGARVHGEIDWDRRFDHMQQHTGQHVLSAAFDRRLQNPTVSVHLGAETSTIDLARDLSPDELRRCLDEANRVVREDRPVSIRFVSREEVARLPLRKDPGREGVLRLVEISDFDLSACGGTHVQRTGEVGLIGVRSVERVRGGSRVTFVCGSRALRTFAEYREAIAGSVRLLSVHPHELPDAIDRAQQETSQGAPPLDIPAEPLGRLPVSFAARTAMRGTTSTEFTQRAA